MPKSLSDIQVKNIKQHGNYRIAPSLYLYVEKKSTGEKKQWRLRKQLDGKRKWIYIGSYPAMSPTEARKKAAFLLEGELDPKAILRDLKQKKAASAVKESLKTITFATLADEYLERIKQPVWKSGGKSEQSWLNSLNQYILPAIGNKEIEDITPDDLVGMLTPIWISKNETANRTRGRVESIIDYAIAKGISDKRNPAKYQNLLENLLPQVKREVQHHAALPFDDVPGFVSELWDKKEGSYDALKLILLTQVRSADAREALWTQFDLQSGVWTAPIRKLGGEMQRLPLPKKLLWLLQERRENTQDDRLFPGAGRNAFITSNALDKSLDVFARTDHLGKRVTIHGFRSTFIDWATATSSGSREDADRQLGHREKNQTLAAYMRTDLFDRRAKLIQQYEDFALSEIAFSSH